MWRDRVGSYCYKSDTFVYIVGKFSLSSLFRVGAHSVEAHMEKRGFPSQKKAENQRSLEGGTLTEQVLTRCGTCSVHEGRGKGRGVKLPGVS